MNEPDLFIELTEQHLSVSVRDGDESLGSTLLPVGLRSLATQLDPVSAGNPPRPEELTNAVGLVIDHLDDIDREVPASAACLGAILHGEGVQQLASVEAGHNVAPPVVLSRAELEDIFRTLATESAAERSSNPGLPSEWVHPILAVATVAVAVVRGRDLSQLTLGTST